MEVVPGEGDEEDEESVGPHFLRVLDVERVNGKHHRGETRDGFSQPDLHPPIEEVNRRRARYRAREAKPCVARAHEMEEVDDERVRGSLDVVLEIVPDIESGFGDALAERDDLVDPQALGSELENPESERRKDQGDDEFRVLLVHPSGCPSRAAALFLRVTTAL